MSSHKLSFLVSRYKENGAWVLYNWQNTLNVTIASQDHPLYGILERPDNSIWFDKQDFDEYCQDWDYLLENDFITDSDATTQRFIEEQYKLSNSSSKLELILMPVDQKCNFNCVYCYEDHNKKGKMGDADFEIISRLIKASQNVSEIGIDYFGGEPLLNTNFIIRMNDFAISYCNDSKISFTSSMTTNGYLLTSGLMLQLVKSGITNFQITLDGDKESHDKLRPLVNGKGTFDKIYENLLSLRSLPDDIKFLVIVRINFNLSNSSKEEIEKFISKISSDFSEDKRFIINPHEILNWKSEVDDANMYLDRKEGIERGKIFQKEISRRGLIPFKAINYSGSESNSCYAGRKNSFVIFPSTKEGVSTIMPVQKCTVGLFEKGNNVGFLSDSGHIVENENLEKWVSNSAFRKEDCKTCFFVLNCYGSSCPLNEIKFNKIKCPDEKYMEIEVVKEIMSFIEKN